VKRQALLIIIIITIITIIIRRYLILLDAGRAVVTFREKLSAECQRIYDYGVERYEARQAELQQVRDCIDEATSSSRQHATDLVNQFSEYKNEVSHASRRDAWSTQPCIPPRRVA